MLSDIIVAFCIALR